MQYGRHGGHLLFSLNIQIDVTLNPLTDRNEIWWEFSYLQGLRFLKSQILPKSDMDFLGFSQNIQIDVTLEPFDRSN
jgi:hypothetical protein